MCSTYVVSSTQSKIQLRFQLIYLLNLVSSSATSSDLLKIKTSLPFRDSNLLALVDLVRIIIFSLLLVAIAVLVYQEYLVISAE